MRDPVAYPHSQLTGQIIGAAMVVHSRLGPGLLESCYQQALARELRTRGLEFEQQVSIRVEYDGEDLGVAYRADFVVEDRVILELKSVRVVDDAHKRQLLTYVRVSRFRLGLLLNFGAAHLRDGITRIVAR